MWVEVTIKINDDTRRRLINMDCIEEIFEVAQGVKLCFNREEAEMVVMEPSYAWFRDNLPLLKQTPEIKWPALTKEQIAQVQEQVERLCGTATGRFMSPNKAHRFIPCEHGVPTHQACPECDRP